MSNLEAYICLNFYFYYRLILLFCEYKVNTFNDFERNLKMRKNFLTRYTGLISCLMILSQLAVMPVSTVHASANEKKVIQNSKSVLSRSGKPHATWKRYNHNHNGFQCYKITQKMSAKEVANIARNAKNIKNVTDIGSIIGGMHSGWVSGLIALYGWNVKNQLAPFTAAAKKGKGLQYSYINHSSSTTTISYNTNDKFVQI